MNKLTAWIKDYAYLFSGTIIAYSKRTPPKHYLGHIADGKAPIVILPGVLMPWAFLKPIADNISHRGHPVYIVPRLGNNAADIPTSAKKVREVIEENKLEKVIIVAHSKGGLIGKYLLVREDPDKRIKGVIAIATPFHGSSAVKFIPHVSVRELAPDSKIIRYLEEHSEVNDKIVSIYPSFDNHVWHPKGSYLAGAMQNIRVDVAGHHKVLDDKIVWNKVEEWIEKITRL
jgi:pimeloyl-ACP methyl ester carboxylesterase